MTKVCADANLFFITTYPLHLSNTQKRLTSSFMDKPSGKSCFVIGLEMNIPKEKMYIVLFIDILQIQRDFYFPNNLYRETFYSMKDRTE